MNQEQNAKKRFHPALVLLPLLVAGIVTLVIVFREPLWRIFTSTELMRSWIEGLGVWGPLVFIALQMIQVVVFVIPGEVPQIAGGFLFGFWPGLGLSILGIAAGSSIAFLLARLLGLPFVQALSSPKTIAKFETITKSPRARFAFFLFFLIPGIPKDVLCYVGGLSTMSFRMFFLVSTLARLPGIVGSALMGSLAADQRWFPAIAIAVGALALFLVGYLKRDAIQGWVERLTHRGKKDAVPEAGEAAAAPPPGVEATGENAGEKRE